MYVIVSKYLRLLYIRSRYINNNMLAGNFYQEAWLFATLCAEHFNTLKYFFLFEYSVLP